MTEPILPSLVIEYATHEAYDADNPIFGVIVLGGEDERAVNRFDDVQIRVN